MTTKTVFVSYMILADGIPGLSTATRKEAIFESPQTQMHYWRTQQWKNTSMMHDSFHGYHGAGFAGLLCLEDGQMTDHGFIQSGAGYRLLGSV